MQLLHPKIDVTENIYEVKRSAKEKMKSAKWNYLMFIKLPPAFFEKNVTCDRGLCIVYMTN